MAILCNGCLGATFFLSLSDGDTNAKGLEVRIVSVRQGVTSEDDPPSLSCVKCLTPPEPPKKLKTLK
eukprot:4540215-Amphidinium_carterae.1